MAVLSKFWIAYIHLSDSSKKDDFFEPDNNSFITRAISDFGTGIQGSDPQKLNLDSTPQRLSVSSFPIIPHKKSL
jgi:hypothetical protein